jgi:hypothetical protein
MADTKTKRKIARTKIEDGAAEFMLYGAPNDDGEQTIDRTLAFDPNDINPAIVNSVLAMGFAAAFQNQYQKLRDSDVDPDATADLFNKLLAAMKDGSWSPGRSFDEGEPDDIVLALAEATGRPVHVIAEEIETRMVKDNDGNLVRDKRGRTRRFFNAKMLENLGRDPKVAPIMARLAKERAERMNKDARGNKSSASKLGSLFGEPNNTVAVAAN